MVRSRHAHRFLTYKDSENAGVAQDCLGAFKKFHPSAEYTAESRRAFVVGPRRMGYHRLQHVLPSHQRVPRRLAFAQPNCTLACSVACTWARTSGAHSASRGANRPRVDHLAGTRL